MKKQLSIGFLAIILFSACEFSKTTIVPTKQIKNYFVKNTVDISKLTALKITSQQQFNELFGYAATMNNNQENSIDFDNEYVIPIVAPKSMIETAINLEKIIQKNNEIIVTYKLVLGQENSYSTTPLMLLIVNNKYQGKLIIKEVQ